jgi:hypothetical protein
MSRFSRLIPAVAVTILLAACGQAGENPVGPATPDAPSYDGGIPVLGGNHTDSTATGPSDTGGEESGGTIPPDTTNRGGIPVTGGN